VERDREIEELRRRVERLEQEVARRLEA